MFEEEEIAPGQLCFSLVGARPDVHTQQVRVFRQLAAKGVGPADARQLPVGPGCVRAGPPAHTRSPRVGRRWGQGLDDGDTRPDGGALQLLRRLLGLALLHSSDGEPASGGGGHERPAERAGDAGLELRPALLGELVPLEDQGEQTLEREDRLFDLYRADTPALGHRAREQEPELAGLRLALDERAEGRIVQVGHGEYPVQHADRALNGGRERRGVFFRGGGCRRSGGRRARAGQAPDDFAEPFGFRKSLELVEPAVQVVDRFDPAGHVPRRLGDEDLARAGRRADAGRQIHHAPEVVTALLDGLARVDADADRDPGARLVLIRLGDRLLDRDRAQDGAAGRREGDHEAVAVRLDDDAAERLDLLADGGVMLAQDPVGRLVPEPLRVVREAPDVAEEDGDGAAERRRRPRHGLGTLDLSLRARFHVAR